MDRIVNIDKTVVKRTTNTKNKPVDVPLVEELPSPLVQFCTNNILDGCCIKEAKNLAKLMELAYANK
jgi:hypothetical protein